MYVCLCVSVCLSGADVQLDQFLCKLSANGSGKHAVADTERRTNIHTAL